MEAISNFLDGVVHYVYTWLPNTQIGDDGNKSRRKKTKNRDERRTMRRMANITTISPLDSKESTCHCPFPPAVSTAGFFRSLPTVPRTEDVMGRFCASDFEVVGYRFLSTEKKLCKRSALKRWIRQKTSNVEPLRGTPRGRHDGCTRLLFEISAKIEGMKSSILCGAHSVLGYTKRRGAIAHFGCFDTKFFSFHTSYANCNRMVKWW